MALTTKTKVIISGVVVTLLAAAVYGKKVYDDYSEVMSQLQFKLKSISNINLKGLSLFFDISIVFINPTNIDFYIDTIGLITVKKIKVYRKGVFIGEANSNLTQIEIPANEYIILKNITIETKYLSFLSELSNLAELSNFQDYKLEIVVDAIGETYVIEQPMS